MKLVTIHQPNYLPWPGFFHKWLLADVFVVLDTVQYHKNEWQNRNRIKTASGAQWLTVPVSYRFPQRIDEVGIAGGPWARKQIAAVEQAYAKAPYLDDYWPPLKALLERPWPRLAELNTEVIRLMGGMLGCTAPLLVASSMQIRSDDPTGRLIDLCKEVGGDAYLSGREGRNYLDADAFHEAGIGLWFQEVQPPHYPQLHGDFIPYLSALDMLLNVGPQAANMVRAMGEMRR
ncbi:MAG TPA: WbqC family protein [Mariprofundaceae bacterium]|nr:WbqC family protein [Mariprofundaceae bacterium]